MDETHDIVPVAGGCPSRKAPRPARPWLELALCVLGSLCSCALSSLGVAAMVFGTWLLARKEENRAWWAVAGCVAPGVVLSFVSWVNYGSLVAPCIAAALVIALLLPGRVSITSVCGVMLALAGLMIASDASIVMMWGEDFAAYVDALLSEMRELIVASLGGSGTSVAIMASVDQTLELLRKIWPLMYVSRAAAVVVVGLAGLMLARRDTCQSVYGAFLRYDAPLWGVVAVAAGFVCLAVGTGNATGAATWSAVGINVLCCVRVLFFLQGLAVAMDLMGRRRWGSFTRVLVLVLLLMAELGLYAVSVFGVIDVWANFRKLPRRARGDAAGETRGEGE